MCDKPYPIKQWKYILKHLAEHLLFKTAMQWRYWLTYSRKMYDFTIAVVASVILLIESKYLENVLALYFKFIQKFRLLEGFQNLVESFIQILFLNVSSKYWTIKFQLMQIINLSEKCCSIKFDT